MKSKAPAERLFRFYYSYCTTPSEDILFSLLNAVHSLNDQIENRGNDLHRFDEFLALKCLRNYLHHEGNVEINIGSIPELCSSDLFSMCLIRTETARLAVDATVEKYQEQARKACDNVFHFYGNLTNINPAIFNLVVKAYELLIELEFESDCEAFKAMRQSYEFETRNGLSHYVNGQLIANAGNVEEMLRNIQLRHAYLPQD